MWTAYVHKEAGGVEEYQIAKPGALHWFGDRFYLRYATVASSRKVFYGWGEPDLRMLVDHIRTQKESE